MDKVKEKVVSKVATEVEMNKEYKSTLKQLQAMRKVPIFIVPTQARKKGTKCEIGINGVIYSIPVGIRFKAEDGVPQPILDVYEDSYERTEQAEADLEVKLKKEVITIQ